MQFPISSRYSGTCWAEVSAMPTVYCLILQAVVTLEKSIGFAETVVLSLSRTFAALSVDPYTLGLHGTPPIFPKPLALKVALDCDLVDL